MNKVEEADEVEKEVDAKVDNLERGKECKVKKTSGEHEVSTSQRRKIPCPLLTCKAEVVHLPRHMRNVHHWTQEAASKVLLKYNIRRRLKKDTREKDYRHRRKCPIADCHSVLCHVFRNTCKKSTSLTKHPENTRMRFPMLQLPQSVSMV